MRTFLAAVALSIAVFLLAVPSVRADPPSPTPRASTVLELAAPHSRHHVKAFASSDYLHMQTCVDGLRGDPGDDDVHAFGVQLRATSAAYTGGNARYDNNRVNAAYVFYFAGGGWQVWNGYCLGSDASFTDVLDGMHTPSGW